MKTWLNKCPGTPWLRHWHSVCVCIWHERKSWMADTFPSASEPHPICWRPEQNKGWVGRNSSCLTHLEPGRRPCPACGLTETWPLLLGSRSSRLSDQSVCYRLPGLQAFELGLELHISSPVPDSCRLRILSLHNYTNQFLVIAFRLLTLVVLLPCRSEWSTLWQLL